MLDLMKTAKQTGDFFLILPSRKSGAIKDISINWSSDGIGFYDGFITGLNKGLWNTNISGDAEISVSNRILTVKSEGNGDLATIYQRFSGTQSADGDMRVKGKFKKFEDGTQPVIYIGFFSGTNRACWTSLGVGDMNKEMRPTVRLGANQTHGSDVTVESGKWHSFEIVVRTNEADFYLNGALIETLTSNVPDTVSLSAGISTTGSNANDKAQVDCNYFWGVHGS